MLVHHLGHGIAQKNHVLVKGFDLTLQFDSIHQINGNRHMLFTQSIEEGVLQKLAFVGHDMFRVGWIKQGLTIA